jgi:hypothetical protein
LARFLWEGRNRTDWPQLQATCDRISSVLTHWIDLEPDQPLIICETAATARTTEPGS